MFRYFPYAVQQYSCNTSFKHIQLNQTVLTERKSLEPQLTFHKIILGNCDLLRVRLERGIQLLYSVYYALRDESVALVIVDFVV